MNICIRTIKMFLAMLFVLIIDYSINLPLAGIIVLIYLAMMQFPKKTFIVWSTITFLEIIFISIISMYYISENKIAAEPIIKSLEDYNMKKKKYPEEIEELVPEFISDLPRPKNSSAKYHYYYKYKDNTYQLSFGHFFRIENKSYNSKEKKWE